MALILNINTAFETASVALSNGEKLIFEMQNTSQKDHASFLEPAIKTAFEKANMHLQDVDAISVINGPGSYTGLRVGLSSAKALCYALQKPLILLNTLDVMALALRQQTSEVDENTMFCPMIDARRMEVFTALYNKELFLVKSYASEVLDENFLAFYLKNDNSITVGGNGSEKLKKITNYKNIMYLNPLQITNPAIILGEKAYTEKIFADVVYSEPFYLKPVYFKK